MFIKYQLVFKTIGILARRLFASSNVFSCMAMKLQKSIQHLQNMLFEFWYTGIQRLGKV